jgi:hypothetical protein
VGKEFFEQPVMGQHSFHFPGLVIGIVICGELTLRAEVNVLTGHNDSARTGLNANETILTPINVNSNGFGRLFRQPVDGPMYAQPLYMSNAPIPNQGTHNVVFAATMHDSVYAFDADSNAGSNAPPLWHTSFINPAAGITAVSANDVAAPFGNCLTFVGEVGIVSTPVIDPATRTLYVVARTKEPTVPGSTTFVQVHRLHALDATTGEERPFSPVVVTARVPGTGDGSSGGFLTFDTARHVQRPGLLLLNGIVYIAWGSYCDYPTYHGWMMGYDAQTLAQVGACSTTPNARNGAIWMGGAGPASDDAGGIYCMTGNGTFDASANPKDFGDSILRLSEGASMAVADYFTPFNQQNLDQADYDLGSGGVVVLPDSVGSAAHPHLLVGCGKEGKVYLVDRDNLGRFNPNNDSQIVQTLPAFTVPSGPDHYFGVPAFFKDRVYFQPVNASMQAFAITNGQFNPVPLSKATDRELGFRGATPSISANGTTNGIVWEIRLESGPTTLMVAYDAEDLSHELYNTFASIKVGSPDQTGTFVKFTVPTIANGKVYFGTVESLVVFGLRSIFWSFVHNRATGMVDLVFSGPTGGTTLVQQSPDLVHWTDLGPGTLRGDGTFALSDPISLAQPVRFYRLREQ